MEATFGPAPDGGAEREHRTRQPERPPRTRRGAARRHGAAGLRGPDPALRSDGGEDPRLGRPQAVGRPLTGLIPADRPADPGHDLLDTLLRHRRWSGRLTLGHREGRPVELRARAELLDHPNGTPLVLAILVENERLRAVEQDLTALDGLFTASPLGIGVFDTELRYTRVNEALSRLDGLPDAGLLGRTTLDVLPLSMAERINGLPTEVLCTGQPVIDLVVPSPDGLGARSVSIGRITGRAGQPMGVTDTVLDTTERRDAQTKIERARQRLALLDDVGAIADLLDVRRIGEALADAIVPRFADLAGAELLSLVASGGEPPTAHDRARGPLLQVGFATIDPRPDVRRALRRGEERAFEPIGPFLRSVFDTGAPYLAETRAELRAATARDPRVTELLRELDVNSLITVPLRARGTVLGLLDTYGLLETRDGDILARVDEPCELLCGLVGELADADTALDGVCDTVIEQLRPAIGGSESDDLALLAARLGSLPPDRVTTWTFPADPAMLPAIGGTVDHRLRGWGLGARAERAGRLVDRLAGDAMAGEGRLVAVRMVYGASLMVEVTAPSRSPATGTAPSSRSPPTRPAAGAPGTARSATPSGSNCRCPRASRGRT